jgi:23S rRNA (pseudouridine1915-N3)-methyltransferase
VPKGAALIAMCVEGKGMSSEKLAERFQEWQNSGASRLCFVVGGSFGLHDSVKRSAQLKLSMSQMTFPHHLARVMLMEQIYRACMINAGTQYHK